MSPTAEIRRAHRDEFAAWCYGANAASEHALGIHPGPETVHTPLVRMVASRPLNPHDDPGWPGGWTEADRVLRRVSAPPIELAIRVWPTCEEAAEHLDSADIVWTPLVLLGTPAGAIPLDEQFWADPYNELLLVGPEM